MFGGPTKLLRFLLVGAAMAAARLGVVKLFKLKVRRGVLVALAVAAIAAAASGFAYAQTSGGNTIKACAQTVNGQLRLDTGNGCLASEQAVQWNEVGPQGPQGPQGPPGPSGTSHVDEWAWYGGVGGGIPIVSGVWPDIRGHETTVLTFHLDRGQYLVSAEILAVNNDGQGVVVCQTGNDTLGITLAQAAVGNTAGFALQQTMQEQTVFVVSSPQDLIVQCFNAPPNVPAGTPKINYVDVTATKIDSSTFNGTLN
jgi:hypothetical protein